MNKLLRYPADSAIATADLAQLEYWFFNLPSIKTITQGAKIMFINQRIRDLSVEEMVNG